MPSTLSMVRNAGLSRPVTRWRRPLLPATGSSMLRAGMANCMRLTARMAVKCGQPWPDRDSVLRPSSRTICVFAVDSYGHLSAFERSTGRRLWISTKDSYVGPPLPIATSDFTVTSQALLVGGSDGTIDALTPSGVAIKSWSAKDALLVTDKQSASFKLGLTYGGNAAWLADDGAVIFRLAAPDTGAKPQSVDLAWFKTMIEPPFQQHFVLNTAAPFENSVAIMDTSRNVYLLDPASGSGKRIGGSVNGDTLAGIDPVISGNTLLFVAGNLLTAFDLITGQTLWKINGQATTAQPVTVAGDTVLWVTADRAFDETGHGNGNLYALNLATGVIRWQAPISNLAALGGADVFGKRVILSTPPSAYDLSSGAKLWSAATFGVGGAAIDEKGQTAYFGELAPQDASGQIVAVTIATGVARWRAPLTNNAMQPFDRLWVSGNTLVVPTLRGDILGLSTADGSMRWQYHPSTPRFGTITMQHGKVWTMLSDGSLIGIDANSGAVISSFHNLNLDLSSDSLQQRPALIGNHIVVSVGSALLGFELVNNSK